MSLARNDSGYNYNGDYTDCSLKQFAQAERRLITKKQMIDDMQNEYNLIERQCFETYKGNINYFIISDKSLIDKSRSWLRMLEKNQDKDGNKLDKRKKYDEKDTYEFYIKQIMNILDIMEMTNVEFIDYNFGQATEIKFDYLGHSWELEIPHIKNIEIRAYQNWGSSVFKLKIRHEDKKSIWSLVGSTYEEDELSKIMRDGINKFVNDVGGNTN